MLFVMAILFSSVGFAENKVKLSDFKRNVYSQWGEDGIIEKIFQLIGTQSKVAIEFGAYDGITYSNTANLWINDPDWKGILIESNTIFFEQALKNVSQYGCIMICESVGVGEQALESILQRQNIYTEVDLLSIDIDGNDYYIFQSLEHMRPRVIVCEYNLSIPAHLDVYSDYGNNIGCSVAALQRIGNEKGYTLVSLTETNAIFVINEEFSKFSTFDTERDHLRFDWGIAYIISDYNGNYKVVGNSKFASPWGWTGNSTNSSCYGDVSNLSKEVIHKY